MKSGGEGACWEYPGGNEEPRRAPDSTKAKDGTAARWLGGISLECWGSASFLFGYQNALQSEYPQSPPTATAAM